MVVRGDAFEVSHPFPLARFLFGQEYAYRASDAAIEVVPGLLRDWIEVRGQPGLPVRPDLDRTQEPEPPDLGRARPRRCAPDRIIPPTMSRDRPLRH